MWGFTLEAGEEIRGEHTVCFWEVSCQDLGRGMRSKSVGKPRGKECQVVSAGPA